MRKSFDELDKRILREFSSEAVSLDRFVAE